MQGCVVTGRAERGRTVITLTGDLDLSGVQATEQAMRACRSQYGEHLVLDLAFLTFLDSAGLSLLLRIYLAAEGRGGSATFCGPLTDRVARILHVTNVDQRLAIHPTLDSALALPLASQEEAG